MGNEMTLANIESMSTVQQMESLKVLLQSTVQQAQSQLHQLVYIENLKDEMRENVIQVKAVGNFMIDFYNEYRADDRVTAGQKKAIQSAMRSKATDITKIIFPSMSEDYEKKSEFYSEWFKVVQGLWSIYRHRVNENMCGYSETPKVKFKSALSYIDSLVIADYLAYRDYRWRDIKLFRLMLEQDETVTMDKIVEKYRNNDDSIHIN